MIATTSILHGDAVLREDTLVRRREAITDVLDKLVAQLHIVPVDLHHSERHLKYKYIKMLLYNIIILSRLNYIYISCTVSQISYISPVRMHAYRSSYMYFKTQCLAA